MNLTEYLKSTGEKAYRFADRVPISRPLIYAIIKLEKGEGARHILLKNAIKIRAASGNDIDLEKLGEAG